MEEIDFEAVLRALRDDRLVTLAEQSVRHYTSWEEINETGPLPGLTVEQTWELLALIRRLERITFPIITLDGLSYWYNLTREGLRCLQHIRQHCRDDSPLHQLVHEREGHRYLVKSQIEESIASCELDGVVFDGASVGRMLQGSRRPRSDAERLVLNSFEMLSELGSLVDEPFSRDLLYHLYERLTRGVDLSALKRGPVKTNLAGSRSPDGLLDERGVTERIGMICDFANRVTGDPWEPVACRGYMILSAVAYWHLLPDLNETVGRHVMRLFAIKNGFPALAYVPTSLMMRRWFDGELEPGTVRFDKYERRQVIAGETDGTADMLIYLELTAAAVKNLRDYIQESQSRERLLLEMLDQSEHLNYRQRSVLSRALANPEYVFTIGEHQQVHKTVYQTSRADLLDLVEKGYLRMGKRGKAFIFFAVDNLQARIIERRRSGGIVS